MKQLSNLLRRKASARAAALRGAVASAALLIAHQVQAALPAPQQGAAPNGDYMVGIRDYVGTAMGLIALIICIYAFVQVSGGAVAKFGEWRQGRAELGDLKMVFVVGGLLLLIVVWLLSQAVTVIATAGTFAGQ